MAPRTSLVHLSGPRRGETDDLRLPAFVGSDAGLEVVVPGIAPRHAFLFEREAEVVLQDAGSGQETLLDGEAVREAVLRDGDVIELGSGGPKLRFRQEGAERVSLLQALVWARPEGGPGLSDTGRFVRTVVRETSARTSAPFRLALSAAAAALLLVVVWTQWQDYRQRREVARLREEISKADLEQRQFRQRVEEERRREVAHRSALEARIEDFRQREDELNRKLAEAASGEVQAVRNELALTRERLATLESERAVAERVIREYGPGVCLIQGSYTFYDAEGRPLRYVLDEGGHPVERPDGSPSLDPAGAGPVYVVEYLGTGFLVDRGGIVLTNRHVAEPWWNDSSAQSLAAAGSRPRFQSLRAFFPREPEPFELTVHRLAEAVDLALVRIDMRGKKIPVLPLDRSRKGAVPGQPVVVVGYPAGLEAILAKADTTVVREILAASGTSSERVTEALARKGLIRPSTTQGHIGDITRTDIVFDAPTTQGGSGGPVLNKDGVVVAVEYAVLTRFGGNSFGVPIGYALDLLRERPRKASG